MGTIVEPLCKEHSCATLTPLTVEVSTTVANSYGKETKIL